MQHFIAKHSRQCRWRKVIVDRRATPLIGYSVLLGLSCGLLGFYEASYGQETTPPTASLARRPITAPPAGLSTQVLAEMAANEARIQQRRRSAGMAEGPTLEQSVAAVYLEAPEYLYRAQLLDAVTFDSKLADSVEKRLEMRIAQRAADSVAWLGVDRANAASQNQILSLVRKSEQERSAEFQKGLEKLIVGRYLRPFCGSLVRLLKFKAFQFSPCQRSFSLTKSQGQEIAKLEMKRQAIFDRAQKFGQKNDIDQSVARLFAQQIRVLDRDQLIRFLVDGYDIKPNELVRVSSKIFAGANFEVIRIALDEQLEKSGQEAN